MTQRQRYEALHIALAEAKRAKGLTQTEVAKRLDKPQSFVSKYESGERRLDVVEFLDICYAISASPGSLLNKFTPGKKPTILEQWAISELELTEFVERNPSLRGILLGYVAEHKFEEKFLNHPAIAEKVKDDDHDRARKGDRRFTYRERQFTVEVKSLQTNLVKNLGGDCWSGKAQVDASDRRKARLPDGSELETTCLLRDEFDVLAINCFAFGGQWRFAFAPSSELPPNKYSKNKYSKYTTDQRRYLLPTLITVEWPLKTPFTEDLFKLLDKLIERDP